MITMKAVRIHSYGGPEVLLYEDALRPQPSAGEILIRVHAAGINPVDWKIREGHLKEKLHHKFPLILGWDVSGVVESIGPGVTLFKPGDEVFSRTDVSRDGAYAEFIVVKESIVAPKPKSLDHVHSASLPLVGLTAWQSLFSAGGLSAGQRVLVHGAAGGVGSIAVQLAKWKGAHVIGTASAKNQDFVRTLGADEVIDYDAVRFEEALCYVDVVFDTQGGETQERSWKTLKPGGILVSIAAPPSKERAAAQGVRSAFVFTESNAGQLAEIAKLADAQKLKVIVDSVFSLAEARQAQELSQRGHTRGKLALRVI